MGKLFIFILCALFCSVSFSQTSARYGRGPAANSSGQQSDFICTDGNSSFPCDSNGKHLNNGQASWGGKTKQQLVDQCLGSSPEATAEECSRSVTQNNRPFNAIPEPQLSAGAAPDQLDKATADAKARREQYLSRCIDEDKTQEACELEYADGGGAKYRERGSCNIGQKLGPDGISCIDDPNSSQNQANAVDSFAACEAAHQDTTQKSCDSESSSWMENINMVAQGVGPMFKPDQGSCGTLAATNVGTSTSIATFAAMCQSSYSNCTSACNPAKATASAHQASEFSEKLKECHAKSAMAKSAQQKAAQATQQIVGAVQSCQAMFGNKYDTQAAQYQANYDAQQALDQLQMGTSNPGLNSQGTSGGTSASQGTTGNRNTNLASLIDGEETTVKPHAITNSSEDPGGNKGGGHVAMGGGDSGPQGGGNARGKGGVLGAVSNILSGFFGGSGGGFGGGSRSGSSGGFKSWFGGDDEKMVQAKNPDLRQFLPGGMKDPNRHRGIAGQWVGADGMSGPHANIWLMINNRYQYKRATLLP